MISPKVYCTNDTPLLRQYQSTLYNFEVETILSINKKQKAELSYADMKVKELAALSGVKKQTIDSYLRENSYTPSVDAAVSIAQALGVSVEYLATGGEVRQGKEKVLSSLSPDIRSLILAKEVISPTLINTCVNFIIIRVCI
ncbi:helix-turn-helix domain-containing protein [Leadbettera azotonutricia]|uniref:Helix-turn-helix domain protein n=1 Tax=Leadbettera azotonutricia (strain ATCC BAA-888 / DSM 13862 / ZAS-9) TaxID=545695 RepID=F5YGH4_LEAAZ|nr:helix-turn-helix transcriptional regulator [Leadbettera azotonutricia]AEF80971.1 helix-turn-helix domain protein [Leadbettera azotonutricia ZAS-9]